MCQRTCQHVQTCAAACAQEVALMEAELGTGCAEAATFQVTHV